MKKILLIATIYRVGERIYPIIPELSKEFKVDVLKTAQMGNKITWYGNNDLRLVFDDKYKDYLNDKHHSCPDLSEYDMILMDDDRYRNGMREIYNKVNVPVIGHQHGNVDISRVKPNLREGDRTSWDYVSVFGKKEKNIYMEAKGDKFGERVLLGGIPSNDKLNEYERTDKHILVIVNFLGNRLAPFARFNKKVFDEIGLLQLQKEFDKKVVIKIKSREDHPEAQEDFDYLNSILPEDLDYEIVMDVEDDNKLISDSFVVISAPSVMAFKPIQKGIPTVLLDGYGQTAGFHDYNGLIKLDKQKIFDEIERQYHNGREEEFIEYTIEGGIDYTSTKKYIEAINNILEK